MYARLIKRVFYFIAMEDNQLLKSLMKKMISLPRFLTYDIDGKGIEVKPGRFSPVYINMKSTWCYPEVLFRIASEIEKLCEGCNHVVGIETGGSPYASVIAKGLKIPLILVRKEIKGSLGYLAGYAKGEAGTFAIVDDVIATGISMENAISSIKNGQRGIRLVSVLSYGMDEQIAQKYGIEVKSIYQVEDVLEAISPALSEVLTPFIMKFKTKLKETMAT